MMYGHGQPGDPTAPAFLPLFVYFDEMISLVARGRAMTAGGWREGGCALSVAGSLTAGVQMSLGFVA